MYNRTFQDLFLSSNYFISYFHKQIEEILNGNKAFSHCPRLSFHFAWRRGPLSLLYPQKSVLSSCLESFIVSLVPTARQSSCGQLLSATLEISLRDILQRAAQTVSKSLWLEWTELGQTGCGADPTHSDVSLTASTLQNPREWQTPANQKTPASPSFLSRADVSL